MRPLARRYKSVVEYLEVLDERLLKIVAVAAQVIVRTYR